jgi:hypothetical protein
MSAVDCFMSERRAAAAAAAVAKAVAVQNA